MALPMLFNGQDCGPSNPLQGLTKQFDRDRGIQQDQFGAARAGSSREVFRTPGAATSAQDQDAAARFFSSPQPAVTPNAFNMSGMQHGLPPVQAQPVVSGWASDFMVQQPAVKLAPTEMVTQAPVLQPTMLSQSTRPQMAMNAFQSYRPMMSPYPTIPVSQNHQVSWDKEFQAQETSFAETTIVAEQKPSQMTEADSDELSRTAGLLLDTVSMEQNPKFKNSAFLGLMKQLRDREIVVEGNAMVDNVGQVPTSTDVKGKSRAIPLNAPMLAGTAYATTNMPAQDIGYTINPGATSSDSLQDKLHPAYEDEDSLFWKTENEDFKKFWEGTQQKEQQPLAGESQAAGWDRLQRDWEIFEAVTTGIQPVNMYQFQANNPYVLGNSSRQHWVHAGQSYMESVLELEAEVQRNLTDANAWYELGVKQQENEREKKALQALERALEIDPSYLPAWLALAVSHTNDSNRIGAIEALRQWVFHNTKYGATVKAFLAQSPERPEASQSDRFSHLAECLMSMARSGATGEVDADIQIALAVLFNTNEDYSKAQDCFRTALAVRPDDWLLYNRVGATMANSGHADDALQYYYRALELNPVYIRARYNLGISCINLRRYEEAAQHILNALDLQNADAVGSTTEEHSITSAALWDSLKTTCIHLQRIDLASLCERHDLDAFRRSFQEGV